MKTALFLLLSSTILLAEVITPLSYFTETTTDRFCKEGFAQNVHGFCDLTFKNKYVTPRGVLVSNQDLVTQIYAGLIFDFYKNPLGIVDKVSFVIGSWTDFSCQQNSPSVGSWNELDWFVGCNLSFCHHWKFNTEYIEFLSPPDYFRAEKNLAFTLIYDDYDSRLPITFSPYGKFFYAIAGDSTVVVGKPGNIYYAEFGLLPKMELSLWNKPLILMAPTWISIGPAGFWNGGVFGIKEETTNFGLFSTGLLATFWITDIPKSLGYWSVNLGFQYYYLINDNLLEAQMFQLLGDFGNTQERNIGVISSGLSVYF